MTRSIDPYEACHAWLYENGYRDVCESAPAETDLSRLDAGIAAYGAWRDTQQAEEVPGGVGDEAF